jgi:cell division protease FtsH
MALNCSDVTAAEIDDEVKNILKDCYKEAKKLLKDNRKVMDKIAARLIKQETITGKEFMQIFHEVEGSGKEAEAPGENAADEAAPAELYEAAAEKTQDPSLPPVPEPETDGSTADARQEEARLEKARASYEEAMAEANIPIPGRDPEDK